MSSSTPQRQYAVGDDIDGRYELRREIGAGGSSRVFEAVHRFTRRSVALKVVTPGVFGVTREELRARLVREARALASLRHPNVVEVLDGGVLEDGTPFLVMEMLEGRTLEGLVASRGQFSVEDTVGLALQLCDALEAAHAVDVVHRDVKPSNILVVLDYLGREQTKLVDFGIARVVAPGEDKLTTIGAVIGTPAYMSREHLLGLDDVDAQTDVYSLGVVMFECLTGRIPFAGNYARVLLQVCSDDPVPSARVARPEVPADLEAVIRRAMAPERSVRFATIGELRHALKTAVLGAHKQTFLLGPKPAERASLPPRPQDQRRRLVRAPYVTPVRLVVGEITIDARTEDISTGGALIICRQICPTNHGVLRFALPIEGTIVALDVQVRWVRAARADDPEGPRAIGVEFVNPPSDIVPLIGRYVELMRVDRAS